MISKIICFLTKHKWRIDEAFVRSDNVLTAIKNVLFCERCSAAGAPLNIRLERCNFGKEVKIGIQRKRKSIKTTKRK